MEFSIFMMPNYFISLLVMSFLGQIDPEFLYFIVSQCILYNMSDVSNQHLFFDCEFSNKLQNQLAFPFIMPINGPCIFYVMDICMKPWSFQCLIVIVVVCFNVVNTLWFCHNKLMFDNKLITCQSAQSIKYAPILIYLETTLKGLHFDQCMSLASSCGLFGEK